MSWWRRIAALGMGAVAVAAFVVLAMPSAAVRHAAAEPPVEHLDPAAWGEDHVGAELPEYVEGGECLFCHRQHVGRTWQTDKHSRTIRDVVPDEPALKALAGDKATEATAADIKLVLGKEHQVVFLREGEKYGHLDVFDVRANAGRGSRWRLTDTSHPAWDDQLFAGKCAGCHATAVESETQAFTGVGHDCYVCHGAIDEEHANDSKLMILAKKRQDPPRVVTSICAQCHLRGGRSRSTGLPYPNQFVAGDNLFRDYEVDWAKTDDPKLNPGDRHIWMNARDVVLLGREETTCLTCHQVHGNSTEPHRKVADGASCAVCHDPAQPKTKHLVYEKHSEVCGY